MRHGAHIALDPLSLLISLHQISGLDGQRGGCHSIFAGCALNERRGGMTKTIICTIKKIKKQVSLTFTVNVHFSIASSDMSYRFLPCAAAETDDDA